MKKGLKIVPLLVMTFLVGLSTNNFAASNDLGCKIAVVDIQKVVASSAQVKSLKELQQTRVKDLQTFVEEAKKSVSAETDKTKQKNLEDKYNKELQQKTADIEKKYAQQLQDIDKQISEKIQKQAKTQNYDIVLSKGVVLYGGDDITDSVISIVK